MADTFIHTSGTGQIAVAHSHRPGWSYRAERRNRARFYRVSQMLTHRTIGSVMDTMGHGRWHGGRQTSRREAA